MPKIVDHDQYSRELIEGCIRLFAERGYGSLTMRDIATALSVSTGTLYHYFPSKEALFDAAVRRVTEQDLGAAELLASVPESPRARLQALFAHIAANEARFAQELLVLLEFRQIHGSRSGTVRAINESADAYVAVIDFFLGTQDPDFARLVFMLSNGLLIKRIFDGGATPFEPTVEVLCRLLPAETAPAKPRTKPRRSRRTGS